ncbi:MAG: hypothetical protein FE78DRAFT_159774 [Acidomyces sp. 'richmondensis']|nr:MAG: hypothetical protein FE78DRAFT_159774 [Acidomyces sp. 'richmondensis']
MADPFEVRMRFTAQLQHLNASTTSAQKAAHYALKYSEFADDLHSCILEQLERNNMNIRANIMYFLPSLCDTAKDRGEWAYVRMMERDILRIVDAVAPDDGSGAANVKVVRKVLKVLEGKQYLQSQTVLELEECIMGRDHMAVGSGLRSSTPSYLGARETYGGNAGYAAQAAIRLDKRQIEQRIEEDRERHKRAREGIWAIPQESSSLREDAEFEKMMDEVSDVSEDDFVVTSEEKAERLKGLEYEET